MGMELCEGVKNKRGICRAVSQKQQHKVSEAKKPVQLEIMYLNRELIPKTRENCKVCTEWKCNIKKRGVIICWNCGRICCTDHKAYDNQCYICKKYSLMEL